jgi:DNA-binding transcriptional LysR family regulator
MELGQLRVFLAVMDTAGVTRAAEMVGLTAGAVSHDLMCLL